MACRQLQEFRRLATMAGDDGVVSSIRTGFGEAEPLDRAGDLLHLLLGMSSGVVRIWPENPDLEMFDPKIALIDRHR
jgi:hypothetical protein